LGGHISNGRGGEGGERMGEEGKEETEGEGKGKGHEPPQYLEEVYAYGIRNLKIFYICRLGSWPSGPPLDLPL